MDEIRDVVAAYRDAAIAHYDATDRGDYKATYITGDRLESTKVALLAHADALPELLLLLDDGYPAVRLCAALDLLPLNLPKAIWRLRMLGWFQKGAIGLTAGWKLRERRRARGLFGWRRWFK